MSAGYVALCGTVIRAMKVPMGSCRRRFRKRWPRSRGQGGGSTIYIETRERVPRDFYIKKSDADKHGYTRGCGGCSSWFRGLGRQPHTDACRERFRGLMQNEAKVQHAAAKRKEFEEKQLDKRRRKEDNKEEKKAAKRKAEQEADDSERALRGTVDADENAQEPAEPPGIERRAQA